MSSKDYVEKILNQKPSLEKNREGSKWYLVQTQSNCEAKAIRNIATKAELSDVKEKIEQMFFPVIEKKVRGAGGKERIKKERIYSNYVFILADMDEAVYEVIKHSDKVTGFVQGSKTVISGLPKPISIVDVKNVIKHLDDVKEGKMSVDKLSVGDSVRIKTGAFTDTSGIIDKINGDKIVVNVTIFGRTTPIDVKRNDIEVVD
tara:strand:+ start:137 stop:745 length:609 start_codon:yes stop_codon:yes gene_type:complete